MPSTRRASRRRQSGQGLVELVAIVPALVVVGLMSWQIIGAAYAWTMASGAARAGGRAVEVGAPAGPAALAAMPLGYATGARVVTLTDGPGGARVQVRVRIPRIIPFLPAPARVAGEHVIRAAVSAAGR
jgi:Flp pilus assembly protein TadG